MYHLSNHCYGFEFFLSLEAFLAEISFEKKWDFDPILILQQEEPLSILQMLHVL
jgi:hypothetical protein